MEDLSHLYKYDKPHVYKKGDSCLIGGLWRDKSKTREGIVTKVSKDGENVFAKETAYSSAVGTKFQNCGNSCKGTNLYNGDNTILYINQEHYEYIQKRNELTNKITHVFSNYYSGNKPSLEQLSKIVAILEEERDEETN